ncbi:hypothetical protein F4820DRAFT_430512 [Hypoxylon rubiginosum]|uniref:Uncharacterized protein n=1 Tax=Hypoxylon rubiginosum TaxID=110542 RepID=A0ACB9YT09_9PEZI|nr:hypothetical protein F4820DRAFT_430512 [Hypoxylon rubiginosum]
MAVVFEVVVVVVLRGVTLPRMNHRESSWIIVAHLPSDMNHIPKPARALILVQHKILQKFQLPGNRSGSNCDQNGLLPTCFMNHFHSYASHSDAS